MRDENMSAEEAAELVGPWHPEVDGRAACLLLPRLARTVVNLHAEIERLRRERDEAHGELLRRWHNSRFQRGMEDTHD